MKIGIITIHKIHNYGSVLQAYALQRVCEQLGYEAEIIDYNFPNAFQQGNKYSDTSDSQPKEPLWIKALFGPALLHQHRGIEQFVNTYINLSSEQYSSPDELLFNAPAYDVYLTGSDQVWNPRYSNGDPSFLLHFAPTGARRVSYAASIGSDKIPEELLPLYRELLFKYSYLSVREPSGKSIIKKLTGQESQVVLDPTLLLNRDDWNLIASKKRIIKNKYILCYYLNYSFNAFPYVDNLAADIQNKTGYEIVRVARPPHHLFIHNTKYCIGASPEQFLALVRDAEMILTTSFHGTAFAVNYGKPVFTVVKSRDSSDSRQINLMKSLSLEDKVLSISDPFPGCEPFYDVENEQNRLSILRRASLNFLSNALP